MQIVSQSATFSYSFFPTQPLLMAPPPRKALPAPRIAGLLPAAVPPRVEIITESSLTLPDIARLLGRIRSREAMNAEIADMALEALQFLDGLRAAKGRCL